MKRHWGIAAVVLALTGAVPAARAQPVEQMSVQIREGALRATPSFLGRPVASVQYGDRVAVLNRRGPWYHVRAEDGREGWTHESALTPKRIVLSAGAEDVRAGASGEEVALAGKGFNEQVEKDFRRQNRDVDYTWVDRMATYRVSPAEAAAFLAEGDVEPREGGVR